MNIERHEGGNNGYSSDELGLRNSAGPLRLRLSQPRGETVDSSTTDLLVRELLHRINDLQARIECLEIRQQASQRTEPNFDAELEVEATQDEFDDPDEVVGAEPTHYEQQDGSTRLNDLPRGPLSIDIVATALGKTVRTIRGWCQVLKYEIPAHKEAGYWRFYKDELMAWHADYERVSRRDAKRAQAKRRRTKHGKQGL